MKIEGNRENFSNLTIEELEFNIKKRYSLVKEMVGQLYPSILIDDIRLLNIILSDKLHGRINKANTET